MSDSPHGCVPDLGSCLADLLDAPRIDVFAALGYQPNCAVRDAGLKAGLIVPPCGECPQERFFAATEYDVGYGGALGGGKTFGAVMVGIAACVGHPGITVGAFRRTYPELEANFIKELARTGYAAALGGRWDGSRRELHFPNGSALLCRYCENMADATRYQGAEFQLLIIDERTLIAPDVVNFLESRVRSGRADVPVLGIRSTFNPGGPGHAAVKAAYIDATDHGAHVVTDEDTGELRRFIPALSSDNSHLDASYRRRLNKLPPAMRAAFRDGSWDSFVGQVFEEWDHARHVVERFAIPPEWRRYAGVDYGYAAPWAVVWAARDPDGRLWVYRERYAIKINERDQARAILAAEAGEHVHRAADPSMWAKTSSAVPVAIAYMQEGCAIVRADNDRMSGLARVHSYLADGPACERHRALGASTCPMLHVLDGCAPNLVRTLPALPYDPHKVEDVDTNADDHGFDALRYLVMGIGSAARFVFDDEPLNPTAPVALGDITYRAADLYVAGQLDPGAEMSDAPKVAPSPYGGVGVPATAPRGVTRSPYAQEAMTDVDPLASQGTH